MGLAVATSVDCDGSRILVYGAPRTYRRIDRMVDRIGARCHAWINIGAARFWPRLRRLHYGAVPSTSKGISVNSTSAVRCFNDILISRHDAVDIQLIGVGFLRPEIPVRDVDDRSSVAMDVHRSARCEAPRKSDMTIRAFG